MFKLREGIYKHHDELVDLIVYENGKTKADAVGDIHRGIEVVEHACGSSHIAMGEYFTGVANNIDTYSLRYPLGVTAGITPFNFPAMIPLWMFPLAITCGNTMVIKPTERAPGVTMKICEYQRR